MAGVGPRPVEPEQRPDCFYRTPGRRCWVTGWASVQMCVFIIHICHSHNWKTASPLWSTHRKTKTAHLVLSRRFNQHQGEAEPGKPHGTGKRLPWPQCPCPWAPHHPVTKASRCVQKGVLRPPVLNQNKWAQGQLRRAVHAWPCGRKEKETTENRRKPSKPTPERPAAPSRSAVCLKHCFHINTMNSIIGMPQVLGKLFS